MRKYPKNWKKWPKNGQKMQKFEKYNIKKYAMSCNSIHSVKYVICKYCRAKKNGQYCHIQ